MTATAVAVRRLAGLATTALVRAGELVNRTIVLPLLVFFPTSRCNSRCVSCDWWRSTGADDLTIAEIDRLAGELPALGTRVVVFSGGEPLLRPDVFAIADRFAARGLRLHLLTSGTLLEGVASDVVLRFERVTVSLDGADAASYRAARGVPALAAVEAGVAAVKRRAPELPMTARATLHRLNFRQLPALVAHARRIGLDGISFLPADTSSSDAFGRHGTRQAPPLALDEAETREFAEVVEQAIREHADAFRIGFVAEAPEKLRRLPRYYAALAEGRPCPPRACNAPWISAVGEADGIVRPCFFHRAIGSIRQHSLGTIVDRELSAFRRGLDVATDAVCGRCVCSMKAGWRGAPWA